MTAFSQFSVPKLQKLKYRHDPTGISKKTLHAKDELLISIKIHLETNVTIF